MTSIIICLNCLKINKFNFTGYSFGICLLVLSSILLWIFYFVKAQTHGNTSGVTEGTPIHPCGGWHKYPLFFPSWNPGLFNVTLELIPPWCGGIHPLTLCWSCDWLWLGKCSPSKAASVLWSGSRCLTGFLSLYVSVFGFGLCCVNKPELACWRNRARVLVTAASHQPSSRSRAKWGIPTEVPGTSPPPGGPQLNRNMS